MESGFRWLIVVCVGVCLGCDTKPPSNEAPVSRRAPPEIVPMPPPERPDPEPARQRAIQAVEMAVHVAGQQAKEASPPPWKPQKIMMIGDSMVWFLGEAIAPMMAADGHDFVHLHKASDSIRAWRYESSVRIKKALRRYKPDVVIIVMGTNDYWYPRVERLLPTVRDTIASVGNRPCYWIGPPMWRPDTGIIDLLAHHSSPCQFFDSKPLTIGRKRDGIHPNEDGSLTWAKALYGWLRRHPPRPIHARR
ncbi:MAG: SGNH/GDSL hydrolase family protein [Myxococcota bacterium]